MSPPSLTVVLDVDGTLVDTNYQHALAWYRALRAHGRTEQLWRIHRHIGMGGDQIVTALIGEEGEEEIGDAVREAESEAYAELIGEVAPMEGARELIAELCEGGARVVLASSAKQGELDRYLDLLEARELVHDWTTSADVERTKPEPDLVQAALEKAGGGRPAAMVGDSTWDVRAAGAAGIPTLGVLTGGFSEQELREAGAAAVVESIAVLRRDRAPLERIVP
jgi:HAD superfamily hydrolase (TIGR01549 family)